MLRQCSAPLETESQDLVFLKLPEGFKCEVMCKNIFNPHCEFISQVFATHTAQVWETYSDSLKVTQLLNVRAMI